MGLIAQIQQDIKQITSNADEFGVTLSFVSPDGDEATITGLATKHHFSIDTEGRPVNAKNAHCSFSEELLTEVGYPVRNSRDEVSLKGHKVSWMDSTGKQCEYVIEEWYPDETIGLIVCILGDYEE